METQITANGRELLLTCIGPDYLGYCNGRVQVGDVLVMTPPTVRHRVTGVEEVTRRDERITTAERCPNPSMIILQTYMCHHSHFGNRIKIQRDGLGDRIVKKGSPEFCDYQRQLTEAER